MNSEFFRIKFDRIGFAFEESPLGARVLIEWQGKDLLGVIWSASYSPARGYYAIGVRSVNDKASQPNLIAGDDKGLVRIGK